MRWRRGAEDALAQLAGDLGVLGALEEGRAQEARLGALDQERAVVLEGVGQLLAGDSPRDGLDFLAQIGDRGYDDLAAVRPAEIDRRLADA